MDRPLNDLEWATAVIQHCLGQGVDHFFVAPGSRCTPLTLAIANQQNAVVTQHFDERGLCFATLGYGKATGKPGVFVCTSGTAVANALPAVIEASMEKIPLLLFTADRPDELRGSGANQTIDQQNLFGDYPELFLNMPVPEDLTADAPSPANFLADALAQGLTAAGRGPVHVNWRFREPFTLVLDEQLRPSSVVAKIVADDEHAVEGPFPIRLTGNTLIALGSCRPEEATEAIELASELNCPILSDITSGLRSGSFELPTEFNLPQPDTILHLGGRILCKSWLQWTEGLRDRTQFVHLTPTGQTFNPNQLPQTRIQTPLQELTEKIEGHKTSDAFCESWQSASIQRNQIVIDQLAHSQRLNEPAIAHQLYHLCPKTHGLFVGNSMPIRDMDWYATSDSMQARWVAANRGVSGIDGLLATATGFASGLKTPTTVVLGDLSALHDLNSLALVSCSRWPIIVVVINNQGGHIFDLLPIRQSEHFEPYFATPHGYEFENGAAMFGLEYQRVTEIDDLKTSYQEALASESSCLLEMVTDRQRNLDVRQQIQKAIRQCNNAG